MDPLFAQQLLEKTRRDYDTIAASFSETRERTYDLQPLVRDVKDGESVLDAGCGNGRLLDRLPVGVRYTGCDTSERMIEIARKRYVIYKGHPCIQGCPLLIHFTLGDILALPFSDASFDHVFALAVLHHIPSARLRQQAVRELARVVKQGGRITITVWNLRSLYWLRRYRLWRLLFGVHPKGYDRGDCLVSWNRGVDRPVMRYVHAFTRRELQTLCMGAGLCMIGASHRRNHVVVVRRPIA